MSKHSVLAQLKETKVVAVIRGKDAKEAAILSKAAIEGGIQAIELTYTTPDVQKTFEELEGVDALLGAGTVLDPETARHAMLAGAKFIVSPHFNVEVAKVCNRYGVPYLPGCMTIRDVVEAMESGCDILKLFPANNFEPSFIKSIKGPLPHVEIMPTGGINLNNMRDWIEAGAVAVGIGSDLNKAYNAGGYEAAVELSKEYMQKSKE